MARPSSGQIIDFSSASEKHREDRMHREKEERLDALRERFASALPDRKTPVKDYLKKKRSKKKR